MFRSISCDRHLIIQLITMPLVTMATPIAASEIYLLPVPDPIPTRTRIRKRDKKELSFKIVQLILQCLLITFYTMGTHPTTILAGDPIITAVIGASFFYTFWKIFDANQSDRNKVFLNIMFGVNLIIIALILIPLIMMIQDNAQTEDKYYINMKLSSGILCLLLGVMCFAEAIYVTLNNI